LQMPVDPVPRDPEHMTAQIVRERFFCPFTFLVPKSPQIFSNHAIRNR
jgi:hypothetical protein